MGRQVYHGAYQKSFHNRFEHSLLQALNPNGLTDSPSSPLSRSGLQSYTSNRLFDRLRTSNHGVGSNVLSLDCKTKPANGTVSKPSPLPGKKTYLKISVWMILMPIPGLVSEMKDWTVQLAT